MRLEGQQLDAVPVYPAVVWECAREAPIQKQRDDAGQEVFFISSRLVMVNLLSRIGITTLSL
jgi:hypothetical protein